VVVLPFTPFAGRIKRGIQEIVREARGSGEPEIVEREVIREVPVEVIKETVREVEVIKEVQPPLPEDYVGRKDVDVATLFNGITVKTKLVTKERPTALARSAPALK
jgi:hypothetical protein